MLFCCVVVVLCVVVLFLCCRAQPLKTQTLSLAWERRPALRGPLVLGLALLWLWLLWLLLVWTSLDHLPPDPPPPDRPSPGPPKISLFFSSLHRKFHSFFSLWEVFSLNFGGVFEGRGAQMCTFGLSGCCVEPRRPHQTGPRGFTRQPENSKRAHLSVPALQTPQNSPRENPQREKKE